MTTSPVPAIDGWFTTDADRPALLGTRCAACSTTFFPSERLRCRNPACGGTDLGEVELSRTGTIWSYTDARYRPPPPYVPTSDPFEPFAIAAVHLEAEGMVVLGQLAAGVGIDDVEIGQAVELVVETLFTDPDTDLEQLVWRWKPSASTEATGPAAGEDDR